MNLAMDDSIQFNSKIHNTYSHPQNYIKHFSTDKPHLLYSASN